MTNITAKNINNAGNTRIFIDGSRRMVVVLDTVAIGRGEYLPGWRWSKHAGPQTGKNSLAHIGYVSSGQMVIKCADGVEVTVSAGNAFEVQPGHDAWVTGNETCIALDSEPL